MATRHAGSGRQVDESVSADRSMPARAGGRDDTRQIHWPPSGSPPAEPVPAEPVPTETMPTETVPTMPGPSTAERGRSGDRVTGSPVWSGFVVGLATWILLEIVLVAVDLTGINAGPEAGVQESEWWWSLGAGVVALFVGGLFAGAASRWRSAGDGVLQGLTVWALTVVGLLVLAGLGVGIGFGAFGDVVGIDGTVTANDVPAGAVETAQDAAGIAVLALAATALAAAAGGIVGAKLWPVSRRRERMAPTPFG